MKKFERIAYIPVWIFLAINLLLSGGCKKNEVKVEFQLPASVSDTYNMIYYASDATKGWYIENVAAVQAGKAEMILATRNPIVVLIMGSGSIPRAGFYAERGDKIKITGKDADPRQWDITGNKLTDQWTAWRLANKKALASGNASEINRAVTKFVKENAANPLSTFFMQVYYDRREDEAGFQSTWKMLKDEALQPKWIRMVTRADLITDAPELQQPVKEIIVKSAGNGVDTLRFKGKPMIIYFWRDGDDSRNDELDRLSKTSKEFGDSSARVMADISFDADSTGWAYRIRRDSIKKVVRGWIWRGEADSVVRRLRVPGTPWFMVSDKTGKILYAGDEGDKADSTFRTLVK